MEILLAFDHHQTKKSNKTQFLEQIDPQVDAHQLLSAYKIGELHSSLRNTTTNGMVLQQLKPTTVLGARVRKS